MKGTREIPAIPPKMAEQFEIIEALLVEKLPEGFTDNEGYLRAIKEVSGRVGGGRHAGKTSVFDTHWLWHYYFLTHQYHKSRIVIFYGSFIERYGFGGFAPFFDSPRWLILFYENILSGKIKSSGLDSTLYAQGYCALKDAPFFMDLVVHSCRNKVSRIEEIRAFFTETKRHPISAVATTAFVPLLLWGIMMKDLDAGLDMHKDEIALYKEYRDGPRKFKIAHSDYYEGGWDRMLDAILMWQELSKADDATRQARCAELLNHFHSWYLLGQAEYQSRGLTGSMLFRNYALIDLGLETEAMKDFAKYFMPLIEAWPRLHEKVKTWGVEYDKPRQYDHEEFKRLRQKYGVKERISTDLIKLGYNPNAHDT